MTVTTKSGLSVGGVQVIDPSGNILTNAASATKLSTARNINGVPFDGSADITISGGGGGGGGSQSWTIATSGTLASVGQAILADTSGGPWTLTLPGSPVAGDTVRIADGGGAFGTNPLTVERNGKTILGVAENLSLDVANATVTLVYNGSTWKLAEADVNFIAASGSTNPDAADPEITGSATLTAASAVVQSISMTSDAQSVTLPNATLLTEGSRKYVILNVGDRTFGVRDNAGKLLAALPAGATAELHLRDNTGAAGSWGITGNGLEAALAVVDHTAASTVKTVAQTVVRLTDNLSLHFGQGDLHVLYAAAIDSTPGAGGVGAWTSYETSATSTNTQVHAFRMSDTQALVFWRTHNTSRAAVMTVNPTTRAITIGTVASDSGFLEGTSFSGVPAIAQLTPTLYIVMGINGATAIAVTVSGTTVTLGTAVTLSTTAQYGAGCYRVSDTTAIAFYCDNSNPAYNIRSRVLTASGTTLTMGPAVGLTSVVNSGTPLTCQLSPTKYLVMFYLASENLSRAAIVTVTGTSNSYTAPITVEDADLDSGGTPISAGNLNDNRFQPNLYAIDSNRALATWFDTGTQAASRHVILTENSGVLTAGSILYGLWAGASGGNFPQQPDGFLAINQHYPNTGTNTYYGSEQGINSVKISGTSLTVAGTFTRGDIAFSTNASARFALSGGVHGVWQDYSSYFTSVTIGSGAAPTALTRRGLLHLFRRPTGGAPQYMGCMTLRDFSQWNSLNSLATSIPVEISPHKVALSGFGLTASSASSSPVRIVILEFATGIGVSGSQIIDASGNVTTNAATATKLETPRLINGIAFDGSANITLPASAGQLTYAAKSSAYTVVQSDLGAMIDCTGTFTLSFAAAATLAAGWSCIVRNSGTGAILIDPNGSELIDGRTTIYVYPGESFTVVSTGSALRTVGRTIGTIPISTSALSSASTISVDSPFLDTELTSIRVDWYLTPSTSTPLLVYVKKNGATVSTANYLYSMLTSQNSVQTYSGQTFFYLYLQAVPLFSGTLEVNQLYSAGVQTVKWHGASTGNTVDGTGVCTAAGAMQGLLFSSGAAMTGSYRVYGVRG